MNLALKDVSYNKLKFLSSMFGVSLLIMVTMALGGIIRGVILDSATIIESTGADLWVVQAYGSHPAEGTLGPFVESSRLPESIYHAIEAMPGVAEASPIATGWEHVSVMPHPSRLMKFMYTNAVLNTSSMVKPGWMTMQRNVRFLVIGYEPGKFGGPTAIIAGRGITASHYELVVDRSTGFSVGDRLRIATFDYEVVGLTEHMVSFTADPVVYATLLDAQHMIFGLDPNLLRNERPDIEQAFSEVAGAQPRPAGAVASTVAAAAIENTLFINAIAVKLRPGASAEEVAERIKRWEHLQVYSAAEAVNLQLMGSNRLVVFQLSLLRDILVLITGIVIGLIIYTFTLDKLHEIAMLKLLGAPGRVVYKMILQEALFMGLVGTIVGSVLEKFIEPYFPRRVEATTGDVVQMLLAIGVVTMLASVIAVRRAMHVDPRSVLS